MTSIADLVQIMHGIDAARGRICGNCAAWQIRPHAHHPGCQRNHEPADETDGCDDFAWNSERLNERAMSEYGKTPEKAADARNGAAATHVADNMFHGIRTVFHGHGGDTDDGPEAA